MTDGELKSENVRQAANWRISSRIDGVKIERAGEGAFDELSVDSWLQIEEIEDGLWWLRVGDARLVVTLGPDGREPVVVDIQRGFYSAVQGATSVQAP